MSRFGRGVFQLFILAGAATAIWFFFPNDTAAIRKRIDKVAALASVDQKESNLARIAKGERLVEYFTTDVQARLDGAGGELSSLSGRDQLAETLRGARLQVRSAKIELIDIVFDTKPVDNAAVTRMAALAHINGEQNSFVQEIRLTWRREGGKWLIARIETVKIKSGHE